MSLNEVDPLPYLTFDDLKALDALLWRVHDALTDPDDRAELHRLTGKLADLLGEMGEGDFLELA